MMSRSPIIIVCQSIISIIVEIIYRDESIFANGKNYGVKVRGLIFDNLSSRTKTVNIHSDFMIPKEKLLEELNSTPDRLIVETLNFLQFLKAKEQSHRSTAESLLLHLENIGTWQGDDFDECLNSISDMRLPAEFNLQPNPFD